MTSIITLPLYFMAEKHQRAEQDIQKYMKPKIDTIKSVFSGDERFMLLSVYYRQNKYHPLYALRSSISLIIQIPFFIAAYHFLSNLEALKNTSFGPIMDLAKPDALLAVNSFSINILPIVMTLINCISALFYTKGFPVKDKIQLYGMAALFLILLYNSPSGMVLYWTGNNLFSLVKNCIQKTKQPKRITHILVSVFCFLLVPYLLFIHKGLLLKRISLAVIFALIPLLPFISAFYSKIKKKFLFKKGLVLVKGSVGGGVQNTDIFILSLFIMLLLGGLVIPSSLIASSVQEFSLVENDRSPLFFIANTALQSFGIFLFWPLCLYFIFPGNIRQKLSKIAVVLAFIFMINAFLFHGKYGFMTEMLTFSEKVSSNRTDNLLNLLAIVFTVLLVLLFISHFYKTMLSILSIAVCTLMLTGTVNSIKIRNEYLSFKARLAIDNTTVRDTIYRFSKTGKNVLVIMLDRAISGYIPYIFDEKPELHRSFDGFTWYRNTVSFGEYTNFGAPGLFGGYEYAPLEMQARTDTPLVEKHNEALLLLPKIFLDQGFEVTVTDPPYANYSWSADLSIFDDYPQINAVNVLGKYNNASWLSDKKDLNLINFTDYINFGLLRFSFFKFAPLLFRNYVYDKGKWLTTRMGQFLSERALNNYIALDILPDMTLISENENNSYNVLLNDFTHEPYYLQAPDYLPAVEITDKGRSPFAHEEHYHANIAALLMLGKWFDFLKENNVYDNTRIIIVSDHGRNIHSKFPDNLILPNGRCLEAYTALLMVKDFNTHGTLSIDDSFMTNADVPLIALKDIVDNPVNPFTGKAIMGNKENGITLTTSQLYSVDGHPEYQFDIKPDEWLHIHTNIFDENNWRQITHPAQ